MGLRAASLVLALLAGCGRSPSPAPSSASLDARVPAPAPAGAPVTPHPGMSPWYPVVAASSCEGHGAAVAPTAMTLTSDAAGRWITRTAWGCGCPTGPVFTLVYRPRTSPLQIRLCLDQRQDPCERGCGMPVAWELTGPMHEAGARAVEVAP